MDRGLTTTSEGIVSCQELVATQTHAPTAIIFHSKRFDMTGSAGCGMLVDDDASAAEREALAEAMETAIR